jgi:signal transduction histidine kinase
MEWQWHPLVVPLFVSAALSTSLGVYVFKKRALRMEPSAPPFVGLMASSAGYALGYALQLGQTAAWWKFVWLQAQVVSVAGIPVFSLWFALSYTGRDDWISYRTLGPVGGLSVVFALLAVTNQFHEAMWTFGTAGEFRPTVQPGRINLFGVVFGEYQVLGQRSKPAFSVFIGFVYCSMILTVLLFLDMALRNWDSIAREQALLVTVSSAVPTLGSAVSIVHPWIAFDPAPLLLTVTGVGFAVALTRYRLLDIEPVARELAVEHMEAGYLIVSDGRVQDANVAAADLLHTDAVTGRDVSELLPDAAPILTGGGVTEDNGDTQSVTVTVDGHHLEVAVFQIQDTPGTVLILQDVSERKRQKDRIQRQNERLDNFASVVSHDLRNPLNVAQLRFDLMRDEAPEEHAVAVENNLARMEEMIEDLLTLARSGETVENPAEVTLADTAREAWKHAAVADAELVLSVPREVTVKADRGRLLHVFENLYRNAADHNDLPLTVRVGLLDAELATDGGRRPGFYIEDDGHGIPASERADIFEHGYTTSDDGTGFGLSIVRDIVDAHGWEIQVTTSSDGGARFEITGVDIES